MSGFESKIARLDDVELHYVHAGHGKLILFVHGFPEFWRAWEDQLDCFGRDYQAVAPDMRGYNLSSRPAHVEKYHIDLLIEDLRGLAGHLGHGKMILVAHDWGGAVAWSFAIRHPEMVEKLVIINSPHPAVFARELLHNPDQRKASEYMLLFRSAEAEQILAENDYARLLEAMTGFGSKWKMTEKMRRHYIEAWSRPGALTGGLNYYRASPLYPPVSKEDEDRIRGILELPREMFRVKVPTLVIWGEQDQALLTGNLDGLETYVDDLTVRRIPDASHWVIHEQPERINAWIREFITRD